MRIWTSGAPPSVSALVGWLVFLGLCAECVDYPDFARMKASLDAVIAGREADISRLAGPTGEQAIQEARTKANAGLFWKDSVDASRTTTRLFLPNFFNTFCAHLRQEQVYGNILGNLGSVLDIMGKRGEATACFSEAEEFLK